MAFVTQLQGAADAEYPGVRLEFCRSCATPHRRRISQQICGTQQPSNSGQIERSLVRSMRDCVRPLWATSTSALPPHTPDCRSAAHAPNVTLMWCMGTPPAAIVDT